MIALLSPVAFLLAAGFAVLSSIAPGLFALQAAWAGAGVLLAAAFRFVNWRTLLANRLLIPGLYVLASVLLLITLFGAPTIRSTRSWIVVGSFHAQPVELAKAALILMYARYFSRRHLSIARWQNITLSFFVFAFPAALVLLQPDLGSAIVLFGIWFGFLLVSGLPRRHVLIAILGFVIAGAFGWQGFLKDYQRERIVGLFYPEMNALTVNYSAIQSKIAIGSAGWLGKGYGQGSQTQLGFLTEPESDFILAALIEEWGLLAGFLAVGAFLFLAWQILRIGFCARTNFERFVCLGIVMVWGIHFAINTGSTIGLLPVVGIPVPFLSYGGSHLLLDFFLLGLAYGIARES